MYKLLISALLFATSAGATDIVYIPGSSTAIYDKDSIERNGDFASVLGSSTAIESKHPARVVFDCVQPRLRNVDGWLVIATLPADQAREASWLRNTACRSWKHPASWFK